MTGPFEFEPPFDDPERAGVEQRAHRKARALMLFVTILVVLLTVASAIVLARSALGIEGG